jgi:ribonuclease HII
LSNINFQIIAGVDEAGRGPLAGPVVAAALVISEENLLKLNGVDDSKKLSAKKREILFEQICGLADRFSIVAVGARRIDKINIREATKLAMKLAIERVNPQLALIDGNMEVPVRCSQKTIIGGDASVPLIGAASILAKVYRDKLMQKLAAKYPGYGLDGHQGYPTASHKKAVSILGPSRIHRMTFRGVKEFVKLSPQHANHNFDTSVLLT